MISFLLYTERVNEKKITRVQCFELNAMAEKIKKI